MEYIGNTIKPEHSGKKSDQSWGLKDEQNWAKWWSKHAPRYKGKTVAQQIRGTENSTLAGAQCMGEGCRPRWGRKVWQLPEHSGLVNCEGVTGAAKEFEAVGWQDQTCLFIKKKKNRSGYSVENGSEEGKAGAHGAVRARDNGVLKTERGGGPETAGDGSTDGLSMTGRKWHPISGQTSGVKSRSQLWAITLPGTDNWKVEVRLGRKAAEGWI